MEYNKIVTIDGYQFSYNNYSTILGLRTEPLFIPEGDRDEAFYKAYLKAMGIAPIVHAISFVDAVAEYVKTETDNESRWPVGTERIANAFQFILLNYADTQEEYGCLRGIMFSDLGEAYGFLAIKIERMQPVQVTEKRRKVKAKDGYVYLIQSPSGYYKIGRAANPNNRLKTFNVKLPFEVDFICTIQTDDMYRLESNLHKLFETKRAGGEWFALDEQDIEYIKGLA